MRFLVIFLSIIAAALTTSVHLETSSVVRGPSLTDSVPVAANDKQSRNLTAFAGFIQVLNILKELCVTLKGIVVTAYLSCFVEPDTCPLIPEEGANSTAKVDSLGSLFESIVRDLIKTNGFDEKLMFPLASIIAKKDVSPNSRNRPFPVTVPTFWNPYVNVPVVALHNNMPNAANPCVDSFFPC